VKISFRLWLDEDEIREWRRATGGKRRAILIVDVGVLITLFVFVFGYASSMVKYYLTGYLLIRVAGLLLRLPDRSARIRERLRTDEEIRLTGQAYEIVDSRGSVDKRPWGLVKKVRETRRLWLLMFSDGQWCTVPKSRLSEAERDQLSAFLQGTALPAARIKARR
jgi:hypothetical protein